MNTYLVATKQSLIDLETFKFIKYKDAGNSRIHRPFFMYEPRTQYPRNESKITTVKLNGFSVEFLDVDNWKMGDSEAKIALYDENRGGTCNLSIRVSPSGLHNGAVGVYYLARVDGKPISSTVNFGVPFEGSPKFNYIPGLVRQESQDLKNNKLYWGIRSQQYKIVYGGRELGGTCYAMLCGAWAILLDDDLSLDSLVLLRSANVDTLEVHKFIYTTNPYIVKVMTLAK